MSSLRVNGVELYYELGGEGDPLVLVHGSWGDHGNWRPVVGPLRESFTVLTYDRRGHSGSERPAGQGSVVEDADDLAALVTELGLAPAHVAANSFGASIALRAVSRHPATFRSVMAHEPPLLALLAGTEFEPTLAEVSGRVQAVVELIDAGEGEAAARLFVDTVAFGPGAWDNQLSQALRDVFTNNAPTYQDECNDPDQLRLDLEALAACDRPILLTDGSESPPFFRHVVDLVARAVPHARRHTIEGADHVPHLSTTERYLQLVSDFAAS
jgi:pimeloyl-ACP methyl ester carboxylesterase